MKCHILAWRRILPWFWTQFSKCLWLNLWQWSFNSLFQYIVWAVRRAANRLLCATSWRVQYKVNGRSRFYRVRWGGGGDGRGGPVNLKQTTGERRNATKARSGNNSSHFHLFHAILYTIGLEEDAMFLKCWSLILSLPLTRNTHSYKVFISLFFNYILFYAAAITPWNITLQARF